MPNVSAPAPFEFAPTNISATRTRRTFQREFAGLLYVEEAGGDVPPRIHSRFAIVLVRAPSVVRLEASRSIAADRNWIVLVPAWQLYALRTHASAVAAADQASFVLQVASSRINALDFAERPAVVNDVEFGAQLAALVGKLKWRVWSADCETMLGSILERLHMSRAPAALARPGSTAAPLAAVRDYLRAHLTEPVSTEMLARVSGLTESHLIRAFHREFGLPPHAYHLRLRLAAACDLLADSLPVSTVAYECGFADQSHLSRKFKESYGMTPAAWANAVEQSRVQAA